jgi:hypothetical protein
MGYILVWLAGIEENTLSDRLNLLCEWGFPLDCEDIRKFVKNYLDKRGGVVSQFQNNRPGKDWVKGFMQRHNFTNRVVSNVKRNSTSVTAEVISKYFDHLEKDIHGVPPENIWNFDETNLLDDVGRKKCVIRRRFKHPERVINTSKFGFSVMFCGNALGEFMPPYTVYKSSHLYEQWYLGGPKGSRYNRSKSRWFNNETFED